MNTFSTALILKASKFKNTIVQGRINFVFRTANEVTSGVIKFNYHSFSPLAIFVIIP